AVLKRYIDKVQSLELIDSFQNPLDALELLNEQKTDLLFLDINLPDISGIELLKSIEHPPKVIFTTAYPEYAIEGFELHALDYLLKPISFDRFLKAINKFQTEIERDKAMEKVLNQEDKQILLVKADKKIFRIPFEEILYLQAYGDYVKVFTHNKMLLPKERLQNLENQLINSTFMRIHRSYLINLNQVDYIEGNQVYIDKNAIPIGKPYKAVLLEKLKE
ncbi:MAG: LytTR family DNA-binding domain-containing protein, partial [Bacteroidota bacterium]